MLEVARRRERRGRKTLTRARAVTLAAADACDKQGGAAIVSMRDVVAAAAQARRRAWVRRGEGV